MTTSEHTDPEPQASLVEPLLPPSTSPTTTKEDDPRAMVPVVELLPNEEEEGGATVERVLLDTEPLRLIVDESTWEHGETQAPGCRNSLFAVLFVLQFLLVLILSIEGMIHLANVDPDDPSNHVPIVDAPVRLLLYLLCTTLAVLAVSATTMMLLLGVLAEMFIQVSLVVSPLSSGIASILALATGQIALAGLLAIFVLIGVWYAVRVWHRIPFAAANVATAMEAIRAHKGVIALAYAVSMATVLFTLMWALAVGGVSQQGWITECSVDQDDGHGDDETDCHVTSTGKWILVGMIFCFYWTTQVFKWVLHTTIAGVVGTWWFVDPEGETGGSSSSALYDSWIRSSVYSFGSICLGSLLVALLQVLQLLVRMGRQQNDRENRRGGGTSLLWCLLQFVVDQLERLMEYINQWAFIYIGLYGYDYWTAGTKVYQLFQARGWSVILNDHLVSRSLGMMQVFLAIVSGMVAILLGLAFFSPFQAGTWMGPTFVLGMILSVVLSNVLFQVVISAVDTVVVCFAEAPSYLQQPHHPPALSSRMIAAWRTAYPNECGF